MPKGELTILVKKQGFTVAGAARELGMTREHVSKISWLSEKATKTFRIALATVIGVEISEIDAALEPEPEEGKKKRKK